VGAAAAAFLGAAALVTFGGMMNYCWVGWKVEIDGFRTRSSMEIFGVGGGRGC
jgi:hypothetical protein